MQLDEALTWGRRQLTASPTPELDARLLLAHVLGVETSYLLAHGEAQLTPAESELFQTLVERAGRREPIPYLIGRWPFRHGRFIVTPAVLIPRPETEELVEHVIRWAQGRGPLRIVDVGTGSGCIAVSLALALPDCQVLAVDISPAALAIAGRNAQEHHAPVAFHQGSLLEPLAEPVDLIVANLPYVSDDEWTQLDDGVKWYEPRLALAAGADGLMLIRDLLSQARSQVRRPGAIFLEIGWQQGAAVTALARQLLPDAQATCHRDLAGRERIVHIEWKASC